MNGNYEKLTKEDIRKIHKKQELTKEEIKVIRGYQNRKRLVRDEITEEDKEDIKKRTYPCPNLFIKESKISSRYSENNEINNLFRDIQEGIDELHESGNLIKCLFLEKKKYDIISEEIRYNINPEIYKLLCIIGETEEQYAKKDVDSTTSDMLKKGKSIEQIIVALEQKKEKNKDHTTKISELLSSEELETERIIGKECNASVFNLYNRIIKEKIGWFEGFKKATKGYIPLGDLVDGNNN